MVVYMFYFYEYAIDTILNDYQKFVNTENKFSRERKFNFKDTVSFFLFNKIHGKNYEKFLKLTALNN